MEPREPLLLGRKAQDAGVCEAGRGQLASRHSRVVFKSILPFTRALY